MKLKHAIATYKKEENVVSNSYEWYRKSALSSGSVSIGKVNLKVIKMGRDWHVNDADFQQAIISHRVELERIKKNTEDYRKGMIKAQDGETVDTEWGNYSVHGDFLLEYRPTYDGNRNSDIWRCKHCRKLASKENNNPECHRCSDWNGCGKDCTLSKVYCNCGQIKKELIFS